MQTFKDAKRREWDLWVSAKSGRTLKDEDALDIFALALGGEGSLLTLMSELMKDPPRAIAIAWVLCRKQAADRDIDSDEFLDAIDMDAVVRLVPPLGRAIALFFPEGEREIALQMMDELEKAHPRLKRKILQKKSELNVAGMFDAEVVKLEKLIAGGPKSTDSAATSASIQTA